MPFKSEAQRRKFAELVEQGKMDKKVFDQFNAETPANIPERIGMPKIPKPPQPPKPQKFPKLFKTLKK